MFNWLWIFIGEEARKTIEELQGRIRVRDQLLEDRSKEISILKTKVYFYEEEEKKRKYIPTPPYWMDTTMKTIPAIVSIPKKNKEVELVSVDIRHFVDPDSVRDIVEAKKWDKITDRRTLCDAIWKQVHDEVKWVDEPVENFQHPLVTRARHLGDCEDSTNLFTSYARAAGIPADEVFSASGWIRGTDGGSVHHAFAITKFATGWYLYDTTVTLAPYAPSMISTSTYKMESAWNDKLKGGCRTESF